MTAQRLVGLAERLEWDALLGAVIRNGRPVALPVRVCLSEESGACGSALGLALCRAVELTYLPGPESHSLAMLALGSQLEDGSFGSVAGTACAAAGLRVYEEQLRAGLGDAALIARVAEASDRAVMALMEMMRGSRRRSLRCRWRHCARSHRAGGPVGVCRCRGWACAETAPRTVRSTSCRRRGRRARPGCSSRPAPATGGSRHCRAMRRNSSWPR